MEYFRKKLLNRKNELLLELAKIRKYLIEDNYLSSNLADCATNELDLTLILLSGDSCGRMVEKIDYSLEKIDSGEYGYCEETGDEIGIGRLELDPTTTLTIEAQEKFEIFLKNRNLKYHNCNDNDNEYN